MSSTINLAKTYSKFLMPFSAGANSRFQIPRDANLFKVSMAICWEGLKDFKSGIIKFKQMSDLKSCFLYAGSRLDLLLSYDHKS